MMDAINRTLLTLLAIVFVALGAVVLLAAVDVLAIVQPSELFERLESAIERDPQLWWPALIGGSLLLALLAAWWAVRQVIVRRPGGALSTLTLDVGDHGRTTVEAAKVAEAAAADLRRLPGVTASSARLVHDGGHPRLRTRIDVPADVDLRSLRMSANDVYARVAGVLGRDALPTQTRIRPIRTESSRVR